jgi:exopolyphosphatase/guanosine-5'-triphosphate,3'-diphosphate pyrophosphatase
MGCDQQFSVGTVARNRRNGAAQQSEFIALIELGSNAVRLLLVSLLSEVGFRVIREERIQTRLGGSHSGDLLQSSVEQTVKAVQQFLSEVQPYHPRTIAVATAAVREAHNRALLLDALRRDVGIEVRVLSGEEEGRLGALAVLHHLSCHDGVIVDLGGGSLQITHVQQDTILTVSSVPLGAVRLTHRFLQNDPPTARELRALREEIRDHVWSVFPRARNNEVMVGLGGTVRALARMHVAAFSPLDSPPPLLFLPRSDVIALREQLAAVPAHARCLPGLKADRADVIVAGTVVIEELMTLGEYQTLTVRFEGGVRQGILLCETFTGGR